MLVRCSGGGPLVGRSDAHLGIFLPNSALRGLALCTPVVFTLETGKLYKSRLPPLENSLPRKQILRHITDSNPGSQNSHPCSPPPGHIRSLSMSLCVYRVVCVCVWGG